MLKIHGDVLNYVSNLNLYFLCYSVYIIEKDLVITNIYKSNYFEIIFYIQFYES
jgi:hypothetical protein